MSQPTPESMRNVTMLAIAITASMQEFGKVHPGISDADVLNAISTVHVNLLKGIVGPANVAAFLRATADHIERDILPNIAAKDGAAPTTH